ncbi:MAG: hypothetical protein Q7J45_00255 [bacterium]|nr:hypothetical protein [bacterium]
MKRYVLIVGGVVLVVVATLWVIGMRTAQAPGDGVMCTQEVKECADGSYVGRTGPKCEFAECPVAGSPGPTGATARIGQEVHLLDVRITPLKVLEDSRCPIDVQCIQAGTVRIEVRLVSGLGTAQQEFKLGQAVTTEAEEITLTSVTPSPKAGVKIAESDYVFTFKVTKRESTVAPLNSGVRGSVTLSPTCPVERMPPDPACAPKPYATAVTVYRAGSKSPLILGNSNASGAFEFSLAPGSYTLSAKGGQVLPRCSEVFVTVQPNMYTSTAISCDTGIR